MVRMKRTERFNTHGAPIRGGKKIPAYCLHLTTDELDQVISGERRFYCFRLETEDDVRELPTEYTYLTFEADGLQIYRDGVPAAAPRHSLGALLESRGAALNLNGNTACCPHDLARQFEDAAGDDQFWGWGLVPTN